MVGITPYGIDEAVIVYMHHTGQGAVVEQQISTNQGGTEFIHHEPGHPGKTEIIYKGYVSAKKVGHFLAKGFGQISFIGKDKVSVNGAKKKTPEKQERHTDFLRTYYYYCSLIIRL